MATFTFSLITINLLRIRPACNHKFPITTFIKSASECRLSNFPRIRDFSYHEILLQRRPAVHGWDWVDGVDDLDRDALNFALVVLNNFLCW